MFALNSNKTHTENCLQTRKTRRSGTSGWRAQSPDLTGRRSSPSAFPKRGGRVLAVGAQAAQSPDLTGRVLRPSQIASLTLLPFRRLAAATRRPRPYKYTATLAASAAATSQIPMSRAQIPLPCCIATLFPARGL
jgi:hypothetical protein